MAAGPDDDFQQYLDMSSMTAMPDGMQFDFNAFQAGNPQQHSADAMMANTEASNMLPRTEPMITGQATTLPTTAAGHHQMSANLMATAAPDNRISDIDAQIQYLQQQKFHQQQRQMQEQRAAFFNTPHGHSVPPTPQSFEMPPGSGHFYSPAEHMQPSTVFERGYHQRAKDQQDVRQLSSSPCCGR